jgi:farnesyl-diphosphate farnesyltransferase
VSSETSGVTAGKPCLPPFSKKQQKFLLEDLVRDVSRSFYLTLRVLPKEIRPQISLAYLFARASDTIADTKVVPKSERIQRLRSLAGLISVCRSGLPAAMSDCVAGSGRGGDAAPTNPAEERLLRQLPDCLGMLAQFSSDDHQYVSQLLGIIIGGQIFDLEQFPGESEHELVALTDADELDRYTYMVAGCVGEFWTKMCIAHLAALQNWNADRMCELGVRFGKGLQLVNVLRDIPKDLRIGRCYLPVSAPRALLDPANYDSIRDEYSKWLDRAVEHLEAGWEYTMQIPPSLWRLRLACIWPIWIGLKTIARLRTGNPLDPAHRIKISRGEVYGVMVRSFVIIRNDAALNRAFQKLRDAASPR